MSVRGERVVHRASDRETNWEPEQKRTYTTVKRYQVSDKSAFSSNDDDVREDKIVIRRKERDPSPVRTARRDDVDYRVAERFSERERDYPKRDEVDYRVTERVVVDRDREPPRRDISYRVIERESDYDRPAPARSELRVGERDRETVRAPSPPHREHDHMHEYRFERERDFSPPRRDRLAQPYELERYSKSTEYFSQPQPQPIIIRESAPQPIIIREERRDPAPIVIREERREPQYEFIERDEVREDRQLVRREEPPPPTPSAPSTHPQAKQDEDYFYERRIREVDRGPRRRTEDEVRPRDSASQYSSDDSYEYIRRERTTEGDAREHSPRHRRHLAEGAIAGIGAAEILRHHRKREGGDPGHRGRQLVGGAAVGALGAEVISRARSMRRSRRGSRSRSRSRSRSSSYESRRDRRRKKKERSRSRSKSRVRQLGGLAAVAAVGALAGYALNKRGKNNETIIVNDAPPRRSRSRRRRASIDTGYLGEERLRSEDRARDPNHRNRRIAQAGLASAAAAGIWEKVRSRSRGAKSRERSKSRVRTGVPIAAAGLGGAALAGLYEKNKASKEAKKEAIIEDQLARGRSRHSRSRSRSRSVPAYPDDRRSIDDQGLIAYGADPIRPDAYGARGYYSDEEPGMYRRRHSGSSRSSSPNTRRRRGGGSRSRSRGKGLAEVGAAAGVAAVAAHEIGKRRERSRAEKERRRHEDEGYHDGGRYDDRFDDRYDDRYSDVPQGYIPPTAGQQAGYNEQPQNYPASNYFPPPPTGGQAYDNAYATQPNSIPPYNPADYPPGASHQPVYGETRGVYGDSDANLGAPYPNDTFAGDQRYAEQPSPRDEGTRGRDPGNVSAPNGSRHFGEPRSEATETQDADGVATSRARSSSRVRFDLAGNAAHSISPEQPRRRRGSDERGKYERHSDSEGRDDRKHRRRRRRPREDSDRHHDSPNLMYDKYDRPPTISPRNGDSDSGDTVDLPPRFDEYGNRKAEGDPLAERINDLLAGKGAAGKLFKGIAGNILGGNGNDDHGSSSGRRRRR